MRNQLWQGANFLSKALFLAVLTPWMLRAWGPETYGLFALASSLFVSLALLDGGVRSLTRVRLASLPPNEAGQEKPAILLLGILTFLFVCGCAGVVALGLASQNLLADWLRLPPGGQTVLLTSGFLTAWWMASVLALEPIAAAGHLSRVKAANTWGMILALPACSLVLIGKGGPLPTIITLIGSLILPNLLLLREARLFAPGFVPPWQNLPRLMGNTLRDGFPYYLTTVALITKTHGLTFLISAVAGPALAGVFYLLLRISEILSNLGATSTETSVAALSSLPSSQRQDSFRKAWTWTALFCLHGALAITLLGHDVWQAWLPEFSFLPPVTWPALALFGLVGAWSQMTVNSSMGMAQIRHAAPVALAESAITLLLATAGFLAGGFPGLFAGGAAAAIATSFQALRLARIWKVSFADLWLRPLVPLLPGLLFAGLALGASHFLSHLWLKLAALTVPASVVLLHLRKSFAGSRS